MGPQAHQLVLDVAVGRIARGENRTDGVADAPGLGLTDALREEGEELALLSPDVRFEQVRERRERRVDHIVAARGRDRVTPLGEVLASIEKRSILIVSSNRQTWPRLRRAGRGASAYLPTLC